MLERLRAFGSRALERQSNTWLVGLYALSLIAFFATIPLPHRDGQLIGSDGIYYYSYLPAMLLEGNLDFANAYAKLLGSDAVAQMPRTATGLLPNAYAVGPALLWSPFFLAAHLLVLLLRSVGVAIAADGIGPVYQAATLIGSISYGFAGLLLIHRSCRRFYNRPTSALSVVLIWSATNLIYYMVAEPSMSHAVSLFAVALFMDLWLTFRPISSFQKWMMLGLAGGLVALVRLPDATFLALPLIDALFDARLVLGAKRGRAGADGSAPLGWGGETRSLARKTRLGVRIPLRRQLLRSSAFGLGAVVAFAPQMAVWQVVYGSPFVSGYLYTDDPSFFWFTPRIVDVLFSPLHGLYTWHPLLLLATVGLGLFYRADGRLALLLGLGLAAQAYVIGAWRDWGQGDAFGGRMFIGSLPALALSLGSLIQWAARRRHFAAVGAIGVMLVAWNGLFLLQYRLGYVPVNAALTMEQFTVEKVSMLADLMRRIITR